MEQISAKTKKVLSQNMWYHGTVYSNWDSFCRNGVLVDINKETSDALDFGYGFYLAPTRERAEHYILSMMENTGFYDQNDIPMILGFEFVPIEWLKAKNLIQKHSRNTMMILLYLYFRTEHKICMD